MAIIAARRVTDLRLQKCVHRFRWMVLLLGAGLVVSGCSHFAGAPVTFDEARRQAIGQDDVFAHPTEEVLKALTFTLKTSGMRLDRIEFLPHKALILSRSGNVRLETVLIPVDTGETRVKTKIFRSDRWADYTRVDRLNADARGLLDRGDPIDWRRLTRGMIHVYPYPGGDSVPVAFLSPETRVDLLEESGGWGKIWLMAGGAGYVDFDRLTPNPADPASDAL